MPNPLKTWTSNLSRFRLTSLAAITAGVAVILVGAYGVSKLVSKNSPQYFNDVDLQITTYSLGGKVLEVGPTSFKVEAGQIVTTSEGNTLTYNTYEVQVDASTIFEDRRQTVTVPTYGEVKPGADVTVYSNQNPFAAEKFLATKVEIN